MMKKGDAKYTVIKKKEYERLKMENTLIILKKEDKQYVEIKNGKHVNNLEVYYEGS